jgi:hypothetical protein
MDIILDAKQTHEYTLKLAFEPSEAQIKRIEQILGKYDPLSISKVDRTIFQNKPQDFPNLDCGEIFIIKAELSRGVQHDIMLAELSNAMKVSSALVKFINTNGPQSTYDDEDLELDEYLPKLLDKDFTDAHAIDSSTLYGDKLSDEVQAQVVNKYNENGTPYSEYMIAGYEVLYPVKRDAVTKSSPTKG